MVIHNHFCSYLMYNKPALTSRSNLLLLIVIMKYFVSYIYLTKFAHAPCSLSDILIADPIFPTDMVDPDDPACNKYQEVKGWPHPSYHWVASPEELEQMQPHQVPFGTLYAQREI